MAKLCFNFGAMSCGKSTALLQVAHNYTVRGYKIILIKPACDKKGDDTVISRIGISRKVDYLISSDQSILDILGDNPTDIECIIADEAQFFEPAQIEELFAISKIYNIPVVCYGLKTDFQSKLFPGSERLLALADELNELSTICGCGKKARFNARVVNGRFVSEGDQIAIDGFDAISYEPLCGECYLKKVKGYNKDNLKQKILVKSVKNG